MLFISCGGLQFFEHTNILLRFRAQPNKEDTEKTVFDAKSGTRVRLKSCCWLLSTTMGPNDGESESARSGYGGSHNFQTNFSIRHTSIT